MACELHLSMPFYGVEIDSKYDLPRIKNDPSVSGDVQRSSVV